MDNDNKFLTESEYFQLEALSAKMEELKLLKIIDGKDQKLLKQEMTILAYKSEKLGMEIEKKIADIQAKEIKLRNLLVRKTEVSSAIKKRLELADNVKLGYNQDTLQIIL